MCDFIEPLAIHAPQWALMEQILANQRLRPALLFVGPVHLAIPVFVNRFMARLNCLDLHRRPCGVCQACQWCASGVHPDIVLISPESRVIKIEQIRDLMTMVERGPVRSVYRFIVIDKAHRLNIAAANALLKLLEEPPLHTHFFLIAEHVSTLPSTILSRCQRYVFSSHADVGSSYLTRHYSSARDELLKNVPDILSGWCDVLEKKQTVCAVASQWVHYDLDDLFWCFYLVLAEAMLAGLTSHTVMPSMARFIALLDPMALVARMDTLVDLMRQLNKSLALNQNLAIERMLS